jgi:hypothetical protein
VVPSPSPNDVITGLTGVSCLSATSCVAVGSNWEEVAQTLIESWDGVSWTVVPSPNQGTSDNQLDSVSCSAPSNCVAVGTAATGGPGDESALIESWDGAHWTIAANPQDGTLSNDLRSVSCPGPSTCVAVGNYDAETAGGDISQPLIETWNGVSWTIGTGVNDISDAQGLSGVSCAGLTNCMAVGFDNPSPYNEQALAETWNGSTWSSAPLPTIQVKPALTGVSCIAATTTCVAAAGLNAESWNGTSWSGEAGIPSHKNSQFGGISCVSTTSCVVVGNYATSTKKQTPPTRTLVATLTGTQWKKTKSPNPAKQQDGLDDVSCLSATSCVAVGSDDEATADKTLVLMSGG